MREGTEPIRSIRPEARVHQFLWAVGEAHHRRRSLRGEASTAVTDVGMSMARHGGRVNVSVTRLDSTNAGHFSTAIRTCVDSGARSVVVDLRGVETIDARGIQALRLAAAMLETANGELVLKSPRCHTLGLLGLTSVGTAVTIC